MSIDFEDTKDFEDDSFAGEIEEVVVEEEPKAKRQNGRKSSNKASRVKVVVVRAFVFNEPNTDFGYVGAVSRGNLLQLLDKIDDNWWHVRIPRGENSPEGFIQSNKVMEI